jgi:hypothetical protein
MTTVAIDTSKVTPEQIGKAYKVFGPDNKPFYMVENSKGEYDEDGNLIEYTVKAVKVNGKWNLTCNCKAGQNGRLCWHVRAAMACANEEKAAMAEQVALNAEAAKQVNPVVEVAKVEQATIVKPAPIKKPRRMDDAEKLHRSRMRGIADILAAEEMSRGLK